MKNLNKTIALLTLLISSSSMGVSENHHQEKNVFDSSRLMDYNNYHQDKKATKSSMSHKHGQYSKPYHSKMKKHLIKNSKATFFNNGMIKYFDKDSKSYVVQININGYSANELSVKRIRRVVSVTGFSKAVSEMTKDKPASTKRFNYKFKLPIDAKKREITAKIEKGMLFVQIPQGTKNKGNVHEIKISVNVEK